MERLTESSLLAQEKDPRASDWLTDNVWHPFVNGTGVKQLYNNFASEKEKAAPGYVPEAKTLSTDWVIHSLASAGGAVLTYAVAGKVAGVGMNAIGSRLGEGTLANVLTNQTAAQIVGAGVYDFIKAPNQGETRLGNMAGTVAAFSVFSGGNYLLGTSKTIAESALYTGLGRVGVGALGGLTSLETSHFVSSKLGAESNPITWNDRYKAMASGGFINVALPPISRALNSVYENAKDAKQFQFGDEKHIGVAESEIAKSTARAAVARNTLVEAEAKTAGGDSDAPKLILLKQQFNDAQREAQMIRVAGELSSFIKAADKSVHAAVYDLRLENPKVESIVLDALNDRADNNVDVKIAYFQPEAKGVASPKAEGGKPFIPTDPEAEPLIGEQPKGPTESFLSKLSPKIQTQGLRETNPSGATEGIPDSFRDASSVSISMGGPSGPHLIDVQSGKTGGLDKTVGMEGITGGGKLMHNKYIARDAGTKNGAVWTGSTNWTDDAFGRQDNNIIQIKSEALANAYEKNFKELWKTGDLRGTGVDQNTVVKIGGGSVTVAFSPGDGKFIDQTYADLIKNAEKNVYIASMVISSPDILKALREIKESGIPLDGIYDGPQMRNVVRAWSNSKSPESAEKLADWNAIKDSLVSKNSHPYSPDGPHDFMHNKTVAVDDAKVATGSFNFSMNATKNAENVLVIDNADTATQYRNYIQDLVKTYGKPKK